MLAALTVLACVLYLAPLAALVATLRQRHWTPVDLASAIVTVFASDFLATFLLTYLVRVDIAAFIRTGLLIVAVVGLTLWRRRKNSLQSMSSGISRADLVALGAAGVVGFLVSFSISSDYWIWDREWHVPFASALRGQKMPFQNVYEPGRPYRYHLSGDLFAALIQSLSFAGMHSSRALSISHDLQSALLVGIGALTFRSLTPWPPVTCALAGTAPLLAGPIGLRSLNQNVLTAYEGYSDFNNFTLSFRPHCIMALVLLAGLIVTLLRLAERARAGEPPETAAVLPLVPIVALAAICDELSIAVVCLAVGAVWLFSPQFLARRRWQGLLILLGLGLATLMANLFLAGTVGPGGPISKMNWRAPRLPHFLSPPMPLKLELEPWKQLFVDVAPIVLPALVVLYILIRDRRRADGLHTIGQIALSVALLSLALFLCFEVNERTFEGHRNLTAARLLMPLVALMFLPRLPRASLASFVLLAPICAGVVVSLGYSYYRLPSLGAPAAAKEQYSVNCRQEFGARVGAKISPTFVDQSIWYPYAGCHPIFAAPVLAPGDVVLVGWPDTGRSAVKKMDATFFPPNAPVTLVCSSDQTKWSEICRGGSKMGQCQPLGKAASLCSVPAARRAELGKL